MDFANVEILDRANTIKKLELKKMLYMLKGIIIKKKHTIKLPKLRLIFQDNNKARQLFIIYIHI